MMFIVRARNAMGLALLACVLLQDMNTDAAVHPEPLLLSLRNQTRSRSARSSRSSEHTERWSPSETALIVCDMWDGHWCKSAAHRVGEMAGPLNEAVHAARLRGVFVIHAPSTCTEFYKNTPQRARANDSKFFPTPIPLSTAPRWGTAWCWTDPKHEEVLPIDDSDMGCDCLGTKCPIREAWSRQIATIEIAAEGAITDDGQQTWNLLQERGIKNVILCGVHLNMCVLGRPFAIRQMVDLGKKVALMRDMTDTMYNPERPPGVSHFEGTDLVVGHVERHWCPTFLSTDITGKPAFRFKDDRRIVNRKN
jgi:nicotinamidase-related amidase